MIHAAVAEESRSPNGADGLMIRSVEISNFRGFEHAELKACKRINVIVGDNGSGKTGLLEGIFLAAGPSPEIAMRMRSWRGLEGQYSGTHEQLDEALWGDLFHNFKRDVPASISLSGSNSHTRSVKMLFKQQHARSVSFKHAEELSEIYVPISFTWKTPRSREVTITPEIKDGVLKIPEGDDHRIAATFFAANKTPSSTETATRFSALSRKFKQREVVDRVVS